MSTPIQNIPSVNILALIPNSYTKLIGIPVTYYYDISGNELYNSFSPISLLSSKCQVPFIGKRGIGYNSTYANTTISTLTLAGPSSITFDKAYNNTYISDTSGVIYKINLYTGLVSLIVGNYTANTGTITSTPISSYGSLFNYPLSTAFDGSGNFYIADQITGQIAKMNLNTSMITGIVNMGTTYKPNCILIDNASNLYFSSTNGINKLSLSGTLPATATTIDSTFTSAIYQMVFYPTNQNLIYGAATTLTPLTIRVFNISTPASSYSITFPATINTTGYGITFDSIGNLYVTSNTIIYFISNTKINSITGTTTLTATDYSIYSSTGINGTAYSGLRWLSVDNANNLYISDTIGNIIYKYINNTYNTNYLLPSNLDLGTTFIPKMMLGGTSSQAASFPISNYIVDSLNSPIEYYIEGATYNIIDNSGLICHYMFNYQDISGVNVGNYASGSFVYDASLSATGMGYQTDYVTGNGCLNLTATSSQYVQVNNSTLTTAWPPAGGEGITIAFWMKPNMPLSDISIFDFAGTSNTNRIVMYYAHNKSINLIISSSPSSLTDIFTSMVITPSKWYHLVLTVSKSVTLCYLNGIVINTYTGNYYPSTATRSNCYIGKSNFPGNNTTNDGQIDDFRIYNRAITDTEAFKLYSFNELSNYYKFDLEDIFKGDGISIANYASGYPIYDASLSAVNSQINGISTSSYMTGNACLCLSGNVVNIPTPNISTNGFTVAFWMNTTSTNAIGLLQLIGSTLDTNTFIYINNSGINRVIVYSCRYTGAINQTLLNTTIPINDGVWHHVVVTSTYAVAGNNTSTIKIYIDNVLNATTNTGWYPSSLSKKGYIGYSNSYNGLIDDFRIYSRVLSSQEITALYNYTYTPDKLAVTAINTNTFTVTAPKYNGISATITTTPTHTDSSSNSIYKTILTGLSQDVGYGYNFTYANGLVLTGNTILYSTPATPELTINSTTNNNTIAVSTQSYTNGLTTGCYFYFNGVVYSGTYSSNSYSITFNGLSSNTAYNITCNVFNMSNITSMNTTKYTTIPSASLTVTTTNDTSIIFTDETNYTGLTSYQIKLYTVEAYTGSPKTSLSDSKTGANQTTTISNLTSNTKYWYQVVADNSNNTTLQTVTTYGPSTSTSSFAYTTIPSAVVTATTINTTSIEFTDTTNYTGAGVTYEIILYTSATYATATAVTGTTQSPSTSTTITGVNQKFTVSGLTANTQYWFQSIATNSLNTSSSTTTTYGSANPLTYSTPPIAPTIVITPNFFSAGVVITPSTLNGSLQITYKLVYGGSTATGTSIPTISGLTMGTSYSYTLTCYNNASYPSTSVTGTFTTSNISYLNPTTGTYTKTIASGANSVLFDVAGTGYGFTVNPGTTSGGTTLAGIDVSFEMCAGGAGGGGGRNSGTRYYNGGGGGGAGQYIQKSVNVTGTYTITIGGGGSGGAGGKGTAGVTTGGDGTYGFITSISGTGVNYTALRHVNQPGRGGGTNNYLNFGGYGGASYRPDGTALPRVVQDISGDTTNGYGGCGGCGTNNTGSMITSAAQTKGGNGGQSTTPSETLINLSMCQGGGGGGGATANGASIGLGGSAGSGTVTGSGGMGGQGGNNSNINGGNANTYGSGGGGGGVSASAAGNGGAGAGGMFFMKYTLT
jgi:hypothetical protein